MALALSISGLTDFSGCERDDEPITATTRSNSGALSRISSVAFTAATANQPQMIWVRSLDADVSHALPGTETGDGPFWSPDGKSIGFFTNDKLKRIDLATGSVSTLADAPAARGGS